MHEYIPYLCIGMNTYLIHAENIIYMCMYVCMYMYMCLKTSWIRSQKL